MSPEQPPTAGACSEAGTESLEELRAAPTQQDDDGNPIWPAADPSRPVGKGNPPQPEPQAPGHPHGGGDAHR